MKEKSPVIQCCVCLKVRKSGKWVKVRRPYEAMEHASHTYCPECMKQAFGSVLKKCRA